MSRISYKRMLKGSMAAFSFEPKAMIKETKHNRKKSNFLPVILAVLAFKYRYMAKMYIMPASEAILCTMYVIA
jgi:hypothetical protein